MSSSPDQPEPSKGEKKFDAILLFGPPGSGKGTVGRILSLAGSHYHLSSGDIFRGLSKESPAGRLYESYATKGHLVPDAATLEIVRLFINDLVASKKYHPMGQFLLLDGIPRTRVQAELIDSFINVRRIILLDMPREEGLIARLKRRSTIEGRVDDADAAVLKTRLEVYKKTTAEVLSHYPKSLVSSFNADQPPLLVLRDILVELALFLSSKQPT